MERLINSPSEGKGFISLEKDFRPSVHRLEGPNSSAAVSFPPPLLGAVAQSSLHATLHQLGQMQEVSDWRNRRSAG